MQSEKGITGYLTSKSTIKTLEQAQWSVMSSLNCILGTAIYAEDDFCSKIVKSFENILETNYVTVKCLGKSFNSFYVNVPFVYPLFLVGIE